MSCTRAQACVFACTFTQILYLKYTYKHPNMHAHTCAHARSLMLACMPGYRVQVGWRGGPGRAHAHHHSDKCTGPDVTLIASPAGGCLPPATLVAAQPCAGHMAHRFDEGCVHDPGQGRVSQKQPWAGNNPGQGRAGRGKPWAGKQPWAGKGTLGREGHHKSTKSSSPEKTQVGSWACRSITLPLAGGPGHAWASPFC